MSDKPPYTITEKILGLIASISEKNGEVNAAYLSQPPTYLRKTSRIKTIHSSLEIEGNTLSLDQVTAVIDNERILGPKKDIIEVKNALELYEGRTDIDPSSIESFLKAHSVLMKGLIDHPGKFRGKEVGIVKGTQVAHIAPDSSMVHPLMKNLFSYLKKHNDLILLKSCVFHYEMEFIHPFEDGNGRMGRFWQSLILVHKYPLFEYLSLESIITEKQNNYYDALGRSDSTGQSTVFIEFMLEVIEQALTELIAVRRQIISDIKRIEQFIDSFEQESFVRKDYLKKYPDLSPATASRDLKKGIEMGLISKSGDKNTTTYRSK